MSSRNQELQLLQAQVQLQEATNEGRRSEITLNLLRSRSQFMKELIDIDDRDINKECGYKDELDIEDYLALYEREGIATRVVEVYPSESWAVPPVIYEQEKSATTDFEKAFELLDEEFGIFGYLEKADKLSGIGQYGIILLGFDDKGGMNQPVRMTKGETRKLLYLEAFGEDTAKIVSYDRDVKSKRFGMPEMYEIEFADVEHKLGQKFIEPEANPVATTGENTVPGTLKKKVHWTRVIHLADNRGSSKIIGTPRLRPVYNRIIDIRKILGADGEGMWKGGFPGISIESHPNIELPEIDKEKTKEEIEKYMKGMQRYLALIGMTAKSLTPQIAEPTAHFRTQLEAICVTIGVPMRTFMGSEEGKLASSQDARNWNKRLRKRQKFYLNPEIIRPFVQRLIDFSVLPTPKKIMIFWPDLNAPTDNDRAVTAAKKTDALAKYITEGLSAIIRPREYLTLVLGFSLEEANAIMKAAGIMANGKLKIPEKPVKAAAGAKGKIKRGNDDTSRST